MYNYTKRPTTHTCGINRNKIKLDKNNPFVHFWPKLNPRMNSSYWWGRIFFMSFMFFASPQNPWHIFNAHTNAHLTFMRSAQGSQYSGWNWKQNEVWQYWQRARDATWHFIVVVPYIWIYYPCDFCVLCGPRPLKTRPGSKIQKHNVKTRDSYYMLLVVYVHCANRFCTHYTAITSK